MNNQISEFLWNFWSLGTRLEDSTIKGAKRKRLKGMDPLYVVRRGDIEGQRRKEGEFDSVNLIYWFICS